MVVQVIEILQHLEELQENGLGQMPGIYEGECISSEDPAFTLALEEFKQRVKVAPAEELQKAMMYIEGRFSEVFVNADWYTEMVESGLQGSNAPTPSELEALEKTNPWLAGSIGSVIAGDYN